MCGRNRLPLFGSGSPTLSQSIEYVKHTEGAQRVLYIADMQIKCGFPIEEAIEDLAEKAGFAPGEAPSWLAPSNMIEQGLRLRVFTWCNCRVS